jgi:NAD-dependent dihydropyrimidine dehydrogenase PreA subunit
MHQLRFLPQKLPLWRDQVSPMSKRTALSLLILLLVTLLLVFACKRVTIAEFYIDPSACNGCGECIRICPNDALRYDSDGKAEIDQSKCTQCGKCVEVCPNSAIY